MIHECRIDHTLNRLLVHFGTRALVRPPAPAASLAALEAIVGPLPRDVKIFFSTCDGLRVQAGAGSWERRIWSVREILEAVLPAARRMIPPGLVPLFGDAGAESDCVAAADEPVRDAVVRWDPSARSIQLMASTFDAWLEAWSQYLMEYGAARPGGTRPEFDAAFVALRDPDLRGLSDDPRVRLWLKERNSVAACGEDCE